MAYVKWFDSVVADYALYRPTYPKSILNIILEFMSKINGSGHNVVVDVGSGSGQSTFFLCDHFEKVIGVDSSAAQITNAQKKIPQMLPESKYKIIEFKVGNAHDLPLEPSHHLLMLSPVLQLGTGSNMTFFIKNPRES